MTEVIPKTGSFYAGLQNRLSSLETMEKTITGPGVTGDVTINKKSGSVNLNNSDVSLVVTNSLVTPESVILCTVASHDLNTTSVQVVAGTGYFTIYPDVIPDGQTRVNFFIAA